MKNSSLTKTCYVVLLSIIPIFSACETENSILQSEPEYVEDNSLQALYRSPSSITLKVLLVEFTDIKHRNRADHNKPAYTFDDFENLFFSRGKYVSPNMYSPDGEEVFGSLHDYYEIMSNGKLNIRGQILNYESNTKGVPEWLQLTNTKEYYQNNSSTVFYKEAVSMAEQAGLDVKGLGEQVKLVIIYAGHMYRQRTNMSSVCGLTPRAKSRLNCYIMSEQFAPYAPRHIESENRTFAHIGTHAHELGHLLGCADHYYKHNDNKDWDLMGTGSLNGPGKKGACPAPLNPYYRWKFGWIDFEKINSGGSADTRRPKYSIRNPEVYQLSYGLNKYFLIEYRKFNSTMRIGSHEVKDYNTHLGWMPRKEGILAWRAGNIIQLIYANGDENSHRGGHIFPGTSNVKLLTPWSDRREAESYFYWIPNTKSSTNCGMEIISDEPGNYVIDLYTSSPEHTTPSSPLDLRYAAKNKVMIQWEKNGEPDIDFYKVYKKGMNDSEFRLFKITENNSIIDNSERIKSRSDKTTEVSYYVTAYDVQNKESAPSNVIRVEVLHTEIYDTNALADNSYGSN